MESTYSPPGPPPPPSIICCMQPSGVAGFRFNGLASEVDGLCRLDSTDDPQPGLDSEWLSSSSSSSSLSSRSSKSSSTSGDLSSSSGPLPQLPRSASSDTLPSSRSGRPSRPSTSMYRMHFFLRLREGKRKISNLLTLKHMIRENNNLNERIEKIKNKHFHITEILVHKKK